MRGMHQHPSTRRDQPTGSDERHRQMKMALRPGLPHANRLRKHRRHPRGVTDTATVSVKRRYSTDSAQRSEGLDRGRGDGGAFLLSRDIHLGADLDLVLGLRAV